MAAVIPPNSFSLASLSHDDAKPAPLPANEAQLPASPSTPPQPSARDNSIAHRLRQSVSSADAASISGVSPHAAEAQRAMHEYVNALFAPYKNGANDAAIDELAANRAAALHGNGETVANLQSLFAYAHAIDLSAHMAAGGSGALPFAVANAVGGQLSTWLPKARDFNVGLLSGFLTYLLVHVGGGVNGRATAHTPWLHPTDLHPAMAEAVAGLQPDSVQKYKEMASFQGFPASFATVGELPTLAHVHSPRAGMIAQSVGGPVTALIGGSVVAGIDKTVEEKHSRSGPALLLASQTWETQLEQLKQRHDMPAWSDRTAATLAGGVRQVSSDFGEKLVQGLRDGVQQLRDQPASTVASTAIWSVGIGLSNFASNQLGTYMTQHGASDLAVAAAKELVFAASLSPINAAWTAVLAFGPAVDAKLVEAVRRMREDAPVATQV
jgi:hypothetical protein